jgi:hypothetical protein
MQHVHRKAKISKHWYTCDRRTPLGCLGDAGSCVPGGSSRCETGCGKKLRGWPSGAPQDPMYRSENLPHVSSNALNYRILARSIATHNFLDSKMPDQGCDCVTLCLQHIHQTCFGPHLTDTRATHTPTNNYVISKITPCHAESQYLSNDLQNCHVQMYNAPHPSWLM